MAHFDTDLVNGPIDRVSAAGIFLTLQRQALVQGVSLRQPPIEPNTCCGRGCHGCVWEGYFAAVSFWREDAILVLETNTD